MSARDLTERLRKRFPDTVEALGEVTVVVDRAELPDAVAYLRDDAALSLRWLSSLTATDWPGQAPRFWMAYELYSLEHGHRVRVKVGVPEEDPSVPSVTDAYPTANWHEREVFDFYGIVFEGHPDLQRIILPDDWEGHPLRKDHALGGVRTQFRGAFIPPVDQRPT